MKKEKALGATEGPLASGTKLPRAKDRVLAGFGHAELHDALGRNLDLLARGGIAADARLTVDQHVFAESGQGEAVLGVLVREVSDGLENLDGLALGEVVFLGDGRRDL